jgi:hypothetical protein
MDCLLLLGAKFKRLHRGSPFFIIIKAWKIDYSGKNPFPFR